MKKPAALVVTGLAGILACQTSYIPGTSIPDTDKNREIAKLVEKYRLAVEQRDVDTLQAMVSRRYYSNAGTTADTSDDYGYERLEKELFPMLRDQVKGVQYIIYLKRIGFMGADRAYAEFEYYYKCDYVAGGKDRWIARNDFMRLEFVKEDGVWRIVSGL